MYNGIMPSLNVRLSKEDQAMVRALRRRGISVSDIVREAIKREFEQSRPVQKTGKDILAYLQALDEKYPLPPDYVPRTYDINNRHEAAEAIRQHLNRKRQPRRAS